MNRRLLALFTAVFCLALSKPAGVLACSVCLAGGGTQDPVSDAFNWSVLFLMAMPYAVIGSVGGWLFYLYRSALGKSGGTKKRAPVLRLAWYQRRMGDE